MPTRQTVLHVINTDGPGGAETVCINLVRGLDPSRWRPVVVLPAGGCGWLGGVLTGHGIEIVHLDDKTRAAVPGYLRGLSGIISRYDVSVIHSHLFGPSILAGLAGRARGVPVVATVHGQADISGRERLQWLKFKLLGLGASRIVFVSDALRDYFLARGSLPASRTVVIPNGIDMRLYGHSDGQEVRRQFNIRGSEFLVGALGNLRPSKAYDVFLRAAAILKAESPDYRFIVVGDDQHPLAESLLSLRAELGLQDDVIFAGFQDNVPGILSSFDLFALTSSLEGFSISIVEAMASRLPVVATRCGGPEQIIEHDVTGMLVENGSASDVARAIASLRADGDKRARMGEAARVAVAPRYDLGAQVRAYEALYDACIHGTT
jgi:glycosyltransferase involved in cell wall biosynthesis